jgi:wyosine [tRNA(Phe)-imidazoG37] synthetase (radical SAM superfamily)
VPVNAVLDQLERKLKETGRLDFISLAGSGEPTLHSELGSIIEGIKVLTQVPVAVLTNGSLLWDSRVRDALMAADVVLPSFDAWDQKGFEAINRPHGDVSFEKMVRGLIDFRKAYRGDIWLEVFVLDNVNATEDDARKLKAWIEKIGPQKIHVNTAVRPTAEANARRASQETLVRFCRILGKNAEVIAPYRNSEKHDGGVGVEKNLLGLLARRPCTLDDMASGLSVHRNNLLECLNPLLENGTIEAVKKGSEVYYQAADAEKRRGEGSL